MQGVRSLYKVGHLFAVADTLGKRSDNKCAVVYTEL